MEEEEEEEHRDQTATIPAVAVSFLKLSDKGRHRAAVRLG